MKRFVVVSGRFGELFKKIKEIESSQFCIVKIITNYLLFSFDSLIVNGEAANVTLFLVDAKALFDRRRTLSVGEIFLAAEFMIVVVVLLLFILSNSLNFGVIDVVGRITFCLNPKRLPFLLLFATCLDDDVFSPPAKNGC